MPTTLTADLLINLWQPQQIDLAPDGARIAWSAKPAGHEGEHARSAIFVGAVDGEPRQWTYGDNDHHPAFSPDGGALAFLSDRAERGVDGLYLAPLAGGEAAPLAVPPGGVDSYRWSPDGSRIAYLAAEKPADQGSDDADVRGADWPYARLHLVTIGTGASSVIDTGDRHIREVTWSPDGTQLACLCTDTTELDGAMAAEILLLEVAGGAPCRLCIAPYASDLQYCTDGSALLYLGPHGGVPVASYTVWSVRVGGGNPVVIGPGIDDEQCAAALAVVPGERRVLVSVLGGLASWLELRDPVDGTAELVYDSLGDLAAVTAVNAANGLVLGFVESTPDRVFEVCAGAVGQLRVVSRHGAALPGGELGTVEDFRWRSDGMELDGVDPPAGRRIRTAADRGRPHGGPYGRSGRTLHARILDWGQWLATAGYNVLMPNYRGGSGHGNGFAAMAYGGVGGGEFNDVMSAVDAAIDRGIADPDRLAIAGWSQGGFLAAWAVTQTDRFAAAVMGAGVSDWRGMVLEGDIPSEEAELVRSRPWDGPGPHPADARSPMSFAGNVRTPVLILHGAADARVPATQGTGFERALRDGPSPVRLVTYPREPHAVGEAAHQRHLLAEVRTWLAQWLATSAPRPVQAAPREVLGWADFGRAGRELAEQVAASGYEPDVILSIARGGLFTAGALGYALDVKNLHVMNVEFYTGVGKRLDLPVMLPPVPSVVDLAGARVLVADDVADTGATLRLVRDFCADHVAEVRCAVIYEKPQSEVRCEYVWRRTDRWINFPWSAEPPVVGRAGAVRDA